MGWSGNEAIAKILSCVSHTQDCLANGKPLLIENIEEELDPILDPVLEKRFIRQARGLTLQLNDKEVTCQLQLPSSQCFQLKFRASLSSCTVKIAASKPGGRDLKQMSVS